MLTISAKRLHYKFDRTSNVPPIEGALNVERGVTAIKLNTNGTDISLNIKGLRHIFP